MCEALARITPGTHDKRSVLVNSGAEAVENAVKIARRATGRAGGPRARPRLPRAHQPHDGDDRAGHALQDGLRAVRRRGLPRAGVLPAARPRRDDRQQAALRAIGVAERQVGADQVAALVVEPILGEGGFVVPAPGFLSTLAGVGGRPRDRARRRRGADRVRAHRRDVRHGARGRRPRPRRHGQGHRGRAAARRGDRAGRAARRRARGRAGRHVRRQPPRVRGGPGVARDLRARRPGGRRPGDRGGGPPPPDGAAGTTSRPWRTCAAAARCSRSSWSGPARSSPTRPRAQQVAAACAAQGVLVLTCGTWGNVLRLLPPLVIGHDLLDEALDRARGRAPRRSRRRSRSSRPHGEP